MEESAVVRRINSILKATYVFKMIEGYKYGLKVSQTTTSAVQILLKGKGWLLRFDNPHRGVAYPHINIRHSLTGIKDPHLRLPYGSLTVIQSGAYVAKFMNLVKDLTIAYDGIMLGRAIWKDYGQGTTKNTVECTADITGQYVGGIVGCSVGTTIGAFIFPGVGPLIGSFALGCLGVHYGSKFVKNRIENYRISSKL